MKRNKKRIIAAVAVIGALAAGGAAFTASNTLPTTDVAGAGSVTVTGATVSSIHNVIDNNANVTAVDLVFSASQAGMQVQGGFSDETQLDNCTDSDPGTDTNWTCTVSHGSGTGGIEPVSGATSYKVVVAQ
jgi:hypothetical protein